MVAFAEQIRNDIRVQPFRWDDDRRFLLRSELDAFYFHLYGIARDEADYIIDTFPITRRKEEQQYGEYRTKRVILEIYDAMAEAQRAGATYQTRLDPPPSGALRKFRPPRGPRRISLLQNIWHFLP
jgi:hypothetical protein